MLKPTKGVEIIDYFVGNFIWRFGCRKLLLENLYDGRTQSPVTIIYCFVIHRTSERLIMVYQNAMASNIGLKAKQEFLHSLKNGGYIEAAIIHNSASISAYSLNEITRCDQNLAGCDYRYRNTMVATTLRATATPLYRYLYYHLILRMDLDAELGHY